MIRLATILVATDFSEASDAALAYGRAFARGFGANLQLLHVAENVYMKTMAGESYAAVFPDLQRDVELVAKA